MWPWTFICKTPILLIQKYKDDGIICIIRTETFSHFRLPIPYQILVRVMVDLGNTGHEVETHPEWDAGL